jgi:hypothetical protein
MYAICQLNPNGFIVKIEAQGFGTMKEAETVVEQFVRKSDLAYAVVEMKAVYHSTLIINKVEV